MKSNKKDEKQKKGLGFSKGLLVQESALIWVITVSFVVLAFFAVLMGYVGSVPWLTALPTVAWAAYGVSQACYYKKSEKENTEGGVVFETTMQELKNNYDDKDNINTDYGI